MNVWPATVITPTVVYRAARVDADDQTVVVRDRQGVELARLAVTGRAGDPAGQRRWWFTGSDGTVWYVEQSRGCGCGGTSQTVPTDSDLTVLTVP
jgi:hypothetical protein